MDFYGPIVMFRLERFEEGTITAYPLWSRVENAECSMSDLNVLKKACREIYEEYGKFYLAIPLFKVFIGNEKDAENALENALLNIRLF